MAADSARVEVDGHRFSLTNLSKVLYPVSGTTKADVIGYLAEVAAVMIPLVRGRPVTRKRWPNGVETTPFFHKNIDKGMPSWIPTREIPHADRTISYPLIDSPATLAWLGQNAALELHVPQWRFTGDGSVGRPDRAVFDLDPGPGVDLVQCAEVARAIRRRLTDLKLTAYPVTSGSKGLHLYVPLPGTQTSEEVSQFAKLLAETVEMDLPALVVSKMAKVLRSGKVFIDWSQNNASKTTIAPYSLRGRELPTVAAPRTWAELDDPDLAHLDYREVLERVRNGIDPFAVVPEDDGDGASAQAVSDKLAAYRSKRSAERTPEPVPAADSSPVATAATGDTFVIQEHHATALHWDFRLEHDGVLVSWAVPKGIPTSSKQNRLAVQTEDHPLAYADFAGTIADGEYGGGDVTIWDSGRYSLEKWRDGEVIVTLDGARATGRFALIRTRRGAGDAAKGNQWLMHRTKDQPDLEPVVPQQGRKFGPDRRMVHRPPPTDLLPMSASSGTLADVTGADWRFEGKWDGVRAIIEIGEGHFRLISRNGNDVTAAYPELGAITDTLAGHVVVLDGEIVAMNAHGRSDFGLLQRRMKLTKPREIAAVSTEVPVELLVFDILHLDGVSLLRKSYDDRRRVLLALAPGGGPVSVPEPLPGPARDALAHTVERHWEGIIAKKAESTYLPGRRSHTWIKIKNVVDQEIVVVGWRQGNGRRAGGIGALLMAVPTDGGLEFVGRVGTGFTDAALEVLKATLEPLARRTSPLAHELPRADIVGVHWVRPELVGEVTYSEWTPDRHLRHPVWRGLRPDKTVQDMT